MIRILLTLIVLWPTAAMANPLQEKQADVEPPLQVRGAVSADYSYASAVGQEVNSFEVRRAELGLVRLGAHDVGGDITIEALRSAGPNSFAGIDGDSLLMRLKFAWAYAREEVGPVTVEGRFGLLPTPWIEATEAESGMRFLEQLPAARLGMYFTSDIGGLAAVSAQDGALRLQVGVFNGEGRNQIEQNNGKNSQALFSARILERPVQGSPLRVRLHLGGQEGSLGPSAAASHRLSLGVSGLHKNLSAGAELHYAFGVGDVSSRDSRALGLWMRGRLRWASLLLRYDNHREDLGRPETYSNLLLGGLFAERTVDAMVVRLGLAARLEKAESNASPLPGFTTSGTIKAALLMFSTSFGGA